MQLNIGVVGNGSIAKHRHLPEYHANEQVNIVAVCDVIEERAAAMAENYGAKAYTDYKKLLADNNVDAVSICLPNYLHAPVTIDALNAGKHVLCEKPMATSEQEAHDMMQAAEKNGKKLMIAHNQRFVPSHVTAKRLIENGDIGKVYSFRTTFGHGGPEDWSIDGKESWFFNKHEAFIGAMGDLGVHKSDLIRNLLGQEVIEVSAMVETSAKSNTNVDDNAVCVLKMENGVIGTLTASWSYVSREDNSTIIYGEKGIIRLEDDPDYSLIVQYKDGETVNYQLGQIQFNDNDGQSDSHVIEQFVDYVLNGGPSPVSGDEGKKSLEVILAALKSNETKQFVQI
ncbi:Gfo/Idh/MocA family protein [Tuberibacillus sp. Marseille-P3662]|uniref:Gfo/Idh/MocA family protein n=1 Tax=Tuberibacillus sp. Marseille-P3662 TaxID=1965358 RepID=UPI000A1CB64F|nr:Gfo/Idh/MocA family oxidoreductase [Tuberibacillus sp. Marseille-P3662]